MKKNLCKIVAVGTMLVTTVFISKYLIGYVPNFFEIAIMGIVLSNSYELNEINQSI